MLVSTNRGRTYKKPNTQTEQLVGLHTRLGTNEFLYASLLCSLVRCHGYQQLDGN